MLGKSVFGDLEAIYKFTIANFFFSRKKELHDTEAIGLPEGL